MHPRAVRRTLTAVIAAALLVALPGAALAAPPAVQPARAVADLNALRQANGLPPVVLNERLSEGCAAHNRYRLENRTLGHGEDPNRPGYSEQGAGRGDWHFYTELLALDGAEWSPALRWPAGTPWERVESHQNVLFNPLVTAVGTNDLVTPGGQTLQCVRVRRERTFPAPRFFSAPGPGARNVALAYDPHRHGPDYRSARGEPLGRQGPPVFVYPVGFTGAVTPVTHRVTDERGREVRTFMAADDPEWKIPTYDYALVRIRDPLRANHRYTATIVWRDQSGRTLKQSLSFRTTARENPFEVGGALVRGVVQVVVTSGAPRPAAELRGPAGRRIRVRLRRIREPGVPAYAAPRRWRPRLAPGAWQVCASSGGGRSGYQRSSACAPLHGASG